MLTHGSSNKLTKTVTQAGVTLKVNGIYIYIYICDITATTTVATTTTTTTATTSATRFLNNVQCI
jgi:hypothetical protein